MKNTGSFLHAGAFDFDGVIADTTRLKSRLFLELFESYPEYDAIKEYERQNQSRPRREKISEILRGILKLDEEDHLPRLLSRYAMALDQHLNKAPLVSGVEKTLSRLHRIPVPLFVVSSGVKDEIVQYLKATNLNHFFKDVFDSKTPKEEALLDIQRRNKIESNRLYFFGDNKSDLEAAQRAGCRFIAINPNFNFPENISAYPDFDSFDLSLLL